MQSRLEMRNLHVAIILHCPLKEDAVQHAQNMRHRGTVAEALALTPPQFPKDICDSWLVDLRYLNIPLRGELAVADRCSDSYGSCILLCSSHKLGECTELCCETTKGKLRGYFTSVAAVRAYGGSTFDDIPAGSTTSFTELSQATRYQTIFQSMLLAACELLEEHIILFLSYIRQHEISKCRQEQRRLTELRKHMLRVDLTLRDIPDVIREP